jgi:hypothetical protein
VGKVVGFQAWQKAVELWEDRDYHQTEVQGGLYRPPPD